MTMIPMASVIDAPRSVRSVLVAALMMASVLTSFALGRLQRFARSGFKKSPTEQLDAALGLLL